MLQRLRGAIITRKPREYGTLPGLASRSPHSGGPPARTWRARMPQPIPAFAAHRIAELTARVRAELDMLSFATKPWVIPKYHAGRKIFDVVIVGAGP